MSKSHINDISMETARSDNVGADDTNTFQLKRLENNIVYGK